MVEEEVAIVQGGPTAQAVPAVQALEATAAADLIAAVEVISVETVRLVVGKTVPTNP